jgi:hypothetical protein
MTSVMFPCSECAQFKKIWDAPRPRPHQPGEPNSMTVVIRHLNLFMTSIAAAILGGWFVLAS